MGKQATTSAGQVPKLINAASRYRAIRRAQRFFLRMARVHDQLPSDRSNPPYSPNPQTTVQRILRLDDET